MRRKKKNNISHFHSEFCRKQNSFSSHFLHFFFIAKLFFGFMGNFAFFSLCKLLTKKKKE